MKYGVSIQRNPKRVVDRIIIPRLAPTQIMSYVSLGMSRPEWIKFVASAVVHKHLDLENEVDVYRLILDASWGWLFQAFLLKREAEEKGENSSGYGTGFSQIQSTGSLGLLNEGISAEVLYWDTVNDLLLELEPGKLAECFQAITKCFKYDIDEEKLRERLSDLMEKTPKEKMRGLFSIFTWIIDENLGRDYPGKEERADLFTIPSQYLGITRDLGITKSDALTSVQKALCSEAPGEISRGLQDFEIAAICHEMSESDSSKAILLSFIVFDLARMESPFQSLAECDEIMRNACSRLPSDEKILEYSKMLYERIRDLLSKIVSASEIVSFGSFRSNCGLETIKKIAVFWEYNLVAGDLEEVLRDFIHEPYTSTPYKIPFGKRWNSLSIRKKRDLKQVLFSFEDLASRVRNNDEYISSFQAGDEFMKSLPAWFDFVTDGLGTCANIRDRVVLLFEKAHTISDAVEFDGKVVKVLKAPTAVNPLIARGAFYNWLRCFLHLWRK